MSKNKVNIFINGISYKAIAPVIISASRSTDIPAFYAKEFFDCLKKGYLYWTNPFNQKKSLISFSKTRFIVFWTKNALPIMPYLERISELGFNFYFNYTLNDYVADEYEVNLPSLESRLETFIKLSTKIGKDKIIWRFDPLILTKDGNYNMLIDKIINIASHLYKHTNKLVVSFVDLSYRKIKTNFKSFVSTPDLKIKNEFIEKLYYALKTFELEIYTCAEPEELNPYFSKKNKCIDEVLIAELSENDPQLLDIIESLKTQKKLNDPGQRKFCGCMVSKDIGRYNSCKYSCSYCYAGRIKLMGSKIAIFE